MLKQFVVLACALLFGATIAAQEMDVERGATPITDGGTDTLGDAATGVALMLEYTITNTDATTLTITTPVTIANETNCTVTVTAQPATSVIDSASTTLELEVTPTANGAFSFDVSIANNDADENPYEWTVDGTGVTVAPEMNVNRGATAVADGATDNIGTSTTGAGRVLAYTISNAGTSDLTITTPVTIGSETNCSVTVTQQPSNTVAMLGTTTLTVSVTPSSDGAFSFTVSIDNDDADENPYNWTVSGTAVSGGGNGDDDDDDDDDDGCSTATSSGVGILGLLGALSAAGLGLRLRRSRE